MSALALLLKGPISPMWAWTPLSYMTLDWGQGARGADIVDSDGKACCPD